MVRIFSAQNEEPHSPKIEWTQLFIAWNSVKSLQLTFYDNDIKDNMKSSGMQRKPPQNSTFVLEQRAELNLFPEVEIDVKIAFTLPKSEHSI